MGDIAIMKDLWQRVSLAGLLLVRLFAGEGALGFVPGR